MKLFLLILSLGSILAAAVIGAAMSFDAGAISTHGWIAISLGTFFTIALTAGLMALVFISARRGYDDRVSSFDEDDPSQG